MTAFIARQAIVDRSENISGYELLSRDGLSSLLAALTNPNTPSPDLGSLAGALRRLTGGRRTLVRVSKSDLDDERWVTELPVPLTFVVASSLDRALIVERFTRLRARGATLAIENPTHGALGLATGSADLVVMDFQAMGSAQRQSLLRHCVSHRIPVLAIGVRTRHEFEEQRQLGIDLFQGPFLKEARGAWKGACPEAQSVGLALLADLQKSDVDVVRIERAINKSTSVAKALLGYINSPYFGLRQPTTSVLQAVTLLGVRKVRQWAVLFALLRAGAGKPRGVLSEVTSRAMFCEAIAPAAGYKDRSDEVFLLGMLSLVHAIIDQDRDKTLDAIPLSEEIRAGLKGEGRAGQVLECVKAYEQGDWDRLSTLAVNAEIDEAVLAHEYLPAVLRGDECLIAAP